MRQCTIDSHENEEKHADTLNKCTLEKNNNEKKRKKKKEKHMKASKKECQTQDADL